MPPRTLEAEKELDNILNSLKSQFPNINDRKIQDKTDDISEAMPENDQKEAKEKAKRENPLDYGYQALKNLNAKLKPFFEKREDGVPVVFTEKNLTELRQSYYEAYEAVPLAANAAKPISAKDNKENVNANIWDKIMDFLVADLTVLSEIKKADGLTTLPQLMQAARSTIVEKTSETQKFDKVGSNSNSRYAFSFEEDGKTIKGFFTPQRLYTGFDAKKMKELAEKSDFINNDEQLKNCLLVGLNKLAEQENTHYTGDAVNLVIKEANTYAQENYRAFSGMISDTLERLFKGNKAKELCEYIVDRSRAVYQYGETQLDAETNSDITGRNVAMSRIAELIGVDHVIAKSRFMTMKDENGNLIDGVFMEKADGIERDKVLPKDIKDWKSSPKNVTPSALKNIAELQLLDYLCQNVDRHGGNMMFQYSKDGTTLEGIKGFDNDFSFGTKQLKKDQHLKISTDKIGKQKSSLDTPLANLKVIPVVACDLVKQLTPENLRYALRDTGLKEKEIAAVEYRLKELQDAIKNKEIEIVGEKGGIGWKDKNIMDLAAVGSTEYNDYGNLFHEVNKTYKDMMDHADDNEYDAQLAEQDGIAPKPTTFKEVRLLIGLDKQSMISRRAKAAKFVAQLAEAQKNIKTSGSAQFRELETATKNYQRFLAQEMQGSDSEKIKAMSQHLDTLGKAAIDYLKYKKVLNKDKLDNNVYRTYKENTQARIMAACKIMFYCYNAKHTLISQSKLGPQDAVKQANLTKAAQKMVKVLNDNNPEKVQKIGAENLTEILSKTPQAKQVLANPDMENDKIQKLTEDAIEESIKAQNAPENKQPSLI